MKQNAPGRWKTHAVAAAALTLFTLAVYWQVAGFAFISNWDDNLYITANPDIAGFTLQNLARVFTSPYVGNYAPLHLLSYMADYQLAGLNAGWFHAVNLALHLANGLLFYLLVLRLTGKPFWGFVSSAVFLLHPVQVESVAWVTERKNLLAMFFSLASFLSYLTYRAETGAKGKRAYLLSVLLLVLALLAKSIAVIIPCVFLCYDLILETPRAGRKLLSDKIPHAVAAALACAVTMVTQSAEMGGGSVDYFGGNLLHKSLTMLSVFTKYLEILVWPSDLSVIYIFRLKTHLDPAAGLEILLALAVAAVGLYLWRRERTLFFGYALFFLGLLPVSQIAPLATLMNDRYLYFPMLGAAWLLGGALSRLNDGVFAQAVGARLLCSGLLIPCAVLAHQRNAVWQNAVTLWGDTAGKYPALKDPRASLAEAYLQDGQEEKALATYREVLSLKRDFSDLGVEQRSLRNAAELLLKRGSLAQALPLLQTLTTKFPEYSPGFLSLGFYHYLSGNLPAAQEAYRKALQIDPGCGEACISLGHILLEKGRTDEARNWYRSCEEKGGNTPELQYALACVESVARHPEKSLGHLAEALQMGYRNRAALTGNPELTFLRQFPDFYRLLAAHFPETR